MVMFKCCRDCFVILPRKDVIANLTKEDEAILINKLGLK